MGEVREATRILVAMSGGVDSSVAAARLCDQGYDVVGVTLHLWDYPDDGTVRGRCCAPEDQHDARRVADHLGVPHYTFDRRELFQRHVVDPFVDAYLGGETPSPCVACNRSVKLRELFPLAERLGAALRRHRPLRPRRARGRLAARSSTAAAITARIRATSSTCSTATSSRASSSPSATPRRTRSGARRSRGACRAPRRARARRSASSPPGRYDAPSWPSARGKDRPAPGRRSLDGDGRAVGRHGGVQGFTVGQRKGLGVALGRPVFVVGLDAQAATVRLGDEAELLRGRGAHRGRRLERRRALPPRGRGGACGPGTKASAPLIDRLPGPAGGPAGPVGGAFVARFHAPVRAISPGQVAVAYHGDRVLGGGTITRVPMGASPPNPQAVAS